MTRETWLYFTDPETAEVLHGRLLDVVSDSCDDILAVIACDDGRLRAAPIDDCEVDEHRR